MMERDITRELLKWKDDVTRKPLILTGVRQCGKTYVLKDFGNRYFENTVYINFEQNQSFSSIFDFDFDVKRIIRELTMAMPGTRIIPGKTFVIFDEIQACPKAITSLKYFCENLPLLHLACAGSLLGVALNHDNISFPVGKVNSMQMFPMSFSEFLNAEGVSELMCGIEDMEIDRSIPEVFAVPLSKALKNYYVVGGMPEVVGRWIETHDYSVVDGVLDGILSDYHNDFSKHAPKSDIPKLGWIWDSVPKQLAKDNNKFVFSHVKEGKRSAELEDALQWLVDAGLIYKLELIENVELPLSFQANATYFKVYMADIGLLRRKSGVSCKTILEETDLYRNFKGAFTENYVMAELIKCGYKPFFWRSCNTAELDFLIEHDEDIVPIEAKAELNTKAKSFHLFCKRYAPHRGLVISMKNVGKNMVEQTECYSLPLYLIWKLHRYLG